MRLDVHRMTYINFTNYETSENAQIFSTLSKGLEPATTHVRGGRKTHIFFVGRLSHELTLPCSTLMNFYTFVRYRFHEWKSSLLDFSNTPSAGDFEKRSNRNQQQLLILYVQVHIQLPVRLEIEVAHNWFVGILRENVEWI